MSVQHSATGVVEANGDLLLPCRRPFLWSAPTVSWAWSQFSLRIRFSSVCSCGLGLSKAAAWESGVAAECNSLRVTSCWNRKQDCLSAEEVKRSKTKQYKSPGFLFWLGKTRVIRSHRVVCQEGNFFPCAAYNQPGARWGKEVRLPLKHKVLAPARGCVPEMWLDMANFTFLCAAWSFHFYATHCNKSNNESSHKGEKERKLLSPSRLEIICLPRYKQLFTVLPSLQGKEAVLNSSVKQILNCHTSQGSLPRPSKGGWKGRAERVHSEHGWGQQLHLLPALCLRRSSWGTTASRSGNLEWNNILEGMLKHLLFQNVQNKPRYLN